MKLSTIIKCVFVLSLTIGCSDAGILDPVYAQVEQFTYPPTVYYHEEEWNALTREEQLAVLQIPEHLLPHLSTSTLIQAYLDYPFIVIWGFDNKQDGFNRTVERFNGLQEVLVRKDALAEAVTYYEAMDPGGYDPSWPILQRGKFKFRFLHMAILLAQEPLLQGLNPSDLQSLLSVLMGKLNAAKNFSLYDDSIMTETTAYALVRVMWLYRDSYPVFKQLTQIEGIETALSYSSFAQIFQIADRIIEIAEIFVNQ